MKINVFEDSRRVALLLQVAWVITCFVVFWNQKPYVLLVFETDGPGRPFVRGKEGQGWHSNVEDGTIFLEQQKLDSGHPIQILLRFKSSIPAPVPVPPSFVPDAPAQPWSGDQRLVPYKEDQKLWWYASRYSPEVTSYINTRAEQFSEDKQYEQAGNEQWWKGRLNQLLLTLAYAIGGWIAIAILKFKIGWIVRGFLGIPSRKDGLSEPPQAPIRNANGA